MKIHETVFNDFSFHNDLRCGIGLIRYKEVTQKFSSKKLPAIELGKVISLEYGKSLVDSERSGEGYPVVGSNGIIGYNNEYLVEGPCIIIGRKGSIGEVAYINENCYPIDTTFYVKQKKDLFVTKYLAYLLSILQLEKLALFKSVPGLNRYDVYKVQIPLIPKDIQNNILLEVIPLEEEIKELQNKDIDLFETINNIFIDEIRFDFTEYNRLKQEKVFSLQHSAFGINKLLRMATIFNHPSSLFLNKFLNEREEFTNLINIVTRKIQRGKQPEYIDNGVKVIKTKNIQRGELDFSEQEYVSEEFYEQHKQKAGIESNDLLLTSTGMGRGKFALYNLEEPAIADSHISIIRFDSMRIKPDFLNYFCQSILGIGQLKYIEMQIKGTPEIYEDQLNYFRIPLVSCKIQEKIIIDVQSELSKKTRIKQKIEEKKLQIGKKILSALQQPFLRT